MLLLRLSTENSTGKTGGGAILQFARFCVVGTSNPVIDFGVLKLGAILGALALSFFGMRFWVFIGKRLSSGPSAQEIGQ